MIATFPQAWLPGASTAQPREQWRAAAGAALGILLTAALGQFLLSRWGGSSLFLVAPMGASAVLLFALPASPLAQPWPVIGGNVLSAQVPLIAASGYHHIPVLDDEQRCAGLITQSDLVAALYAARKPGSGLPIAHKMPS